MIVTINGFVINDSTNANSVYLDEPLSGLSMPPIRTSQGTYSGRDGGYVGSQFYAMRLITMTGFIFSANVAAVETARRAFEAAVSSGGPFPVNITTNAGNQYVVLCYLDGLDIPIQRAPNRAPFILTLIATDPTIFDNSAGGIQTATIAPAVGGGVAMPFIWTPLIWTPGASPTTVTNPGNVLAFPTITLNNAMTNPTILNVTTGQFITFNGLTTSAGDQLVIDMKNRTVLLNGGSILTYVSTTSSWWGLVVGANSIKLTTTNGADTVTGTFTWRTGYRGI
ncbi:phage distal tail protein [Subtercola sp. RTI3]|uniref:phage distal tail protein n=1 Tax=Subtercola sp. RTI3 TaxID=3048639 RepID=UPI002B233185|nr:hypothetical protein [Subtercola sp. RTI3]MEA9986258.1 phage tail family protein [Subtercola sp. RTI3]